MKIKIEMRIGLFLAALILFGFYLLPVIASAQKTKPSAANKIALSPETDSTEPLTSTPPLTPFEREITAELNLARSNPAEYARFLEAWKKNYKGKELRVPHRTVIVTNEGAAGVDEAIAFLKKTTAVGQITETRGLVYAARRHLNDLVKHNLTGHRGSDGSFPDKRIESFGAWEGGISEMINYGGETARETVISIILDDGNPSRPHRTDLFDDKFKLVGLATGDSTKHGMLCVVVMTNRFTEKTVK